MRTAIADAVTARAFGERGVVVLAAVFAAGAWLAAPVPGWIVAAACAAAATAVIWRRPWMLVVIAPVVASALGARAWFDVAPIAAATVHGEVVLVSDPVMAFGATHADARLVDGSRVELTARGAPGRQLQRAMSGMVLDVDGALKPRASHADWLARRHVVGRLEATSARVVGEGTFVARAANGVRVLIGRGARSLDDDGRALFTGFVLGDDRGQRGEVVDDFRASGLSHLVAVSGENVAFVMALVAPALRRLSLRNRFVMTITVLAFFAFVVRFEPSVLRATAMAGVAAWATTVGRPVSVWRALALATLALVAVDPLLVGRVGFLLSVGACAGIAGLARPLASWLPGPRWFRQASGVTVAAQVGVLPVALPVFGGVPLVSIAANLLAVPVAGPIMMWGLTAGVVAGVVGEPLAALLHQPTRVMVWWVGAVAETAARAPVGEVRATHAAVIAVGTLLTLALATRRRRGVAVGVAATTAGAVLVVASFAPVPAEVAFLGDGAQLIPDGRGSAVLVLDGRAEVGRVLEGVRRAGRPRLEVVVLRSVARSLPALVEALRERADVGMVVAPRNASVLDAAPARVGDRFGAGALGVTVTEAQPDSVVVAVG